MLFFSNLSLLETKSSLREKQLEKCRLERLAAYYTNKIEYLSKSRRNVRLALLACRDAPVDYPKKTSKGAEQSYIRTCIRHYKKRLGEINKELKRF